MPTVRCIERLSPAIRASSCSSVAIRKARRGRESLRETAPAAARLAPLRHRERLQLREIEIDRVVTAVGSLPARKTARDVGDVVEIQIVEDDELRIARRDDVLLEIVGTEPVRERLCFERVLGEIAACAAVGDNDRRGGHLRA